MHELYLIDPGPRPPFYELAQELWEHRDYDSEGDSRTPDDPNWTELTISLRPDCLERVDVDPVDAGDRVVLRITSDSEDILRRAADFLLGRSGGSLSASAP